ncbi:ABC transporter permease [Carboxylicivirga marina]|uniref:ABC transporter permease n=1 Tax=Carboxylicivirga marina TaxID=2800988 RepID=UPI0025969408|nr:ABC transporter permease [uncultured Carboxylicivirga sp.]
MMLNHHIKVAIRSIRKQGIYALLNVLGLSVGLVLGLFVILLVRHELSYDSSFSDNERIYRIATKGVLGNNNINSATTPLPLAEVLLNMEEVEEVVRFIPGANNVVKYKELRYNEDGFLFGDSSFFSLFDVNMLEGKSSYDLRESRNVVITQTIAKKYFGEEHPIGKNIEREGLIYNVVGVCENLPAASHFDFGFVASLSTVDEILLQKNDSAYVEEWKSDWLSLKCYTYLKLEKNKDVSSFISEMNDQKDKLLRPEIAKVMEFEQSTDKFELSFIEQPLREIHFSSHLGEELSSNSNPIYIKLFVFVAIFVLLTTCVNFMNLTTAKLRVKYKEVGYRQLVGASRSQLIMQFLVEALVYALGATFIGMVLLEILLPFFNGFFELNLEFNFFRGWIDFFGILLVLLTVGLLAGSFPAFFFSGRKPEKLISGDYKIGKPGFLIRGILVTSQFAVAMFLVVVATAMWWQISFVKESDPGFDSNNVIVVERGHAVRNDLSAFKEETKKIAGIKYVSACNSLPGDDYFQGTFRIIEGVENQVMMLPINYVDEDYFKVMGITLKAGRFLSNELGDSLGINLNVAAVKELKLSKPLDKKIEVFGNNDWALNTVGVIKDFHYESYFTEIKPLALILLPEKKRFEYVLIKHEEGVKVDLEEVKVLWDKYSDGAPFVYTSLDQRIDKLYEEDVRIAKIMSVFAMLSLFIALLGVVALVAFIIEYKSGTFAVKNIIGAPRQSIIRQVFSMYSIYVIAGVILASVPAYWAIQAWGNSYAYFEFVGMSAFFLWALTLVALSFVATFIQTFRGSGLRSVA